MTHGQWHGEIDTTCCVVHGWCAAVPRVLLHRNVESKINHHLQHSFKTLMRMFDMNQYLMVSKTIIQNVIKFLPHILIKMSKARIPMFDISFRA